MGAAVRGRVPSFVWRMELVATLPTESLAEHSVLMAAVRWVNDDGVLWPSVENWARVAKVNPRTLQRVLDALIARGIVEQLTESRGRNTVRYRIPALDSGNPGTGPGLGGPFPTAHTPPQPRCAAGVGLPLNPGKEEVSTPALGPSNSGVESSQPRCSTTPSMDDRPHEQPVQQQPAVMFVLTPELRNHQNATTERLAWIQRDAPSKRNPMGWARACLDGAYEVPPLGPVDAKAAKAAERATVLVRFDSMVDSQREAVIQLARQRFPNLGSYPDDSRVFREGAIATVVGAWCGPAESTRHRSSSQ
jgi:hypothetical protein